MKHTTVFRSAAYSPSRFNTSKTPISPITFFQQVRDEMLEDRLAIAELKLDWIVSHIAIYLYKYFPKLSDSFLLLGLLSPCANPPIMALFNEAFFFFKKSLFSFFLFKYVSVPMIILNEHMHLNMIDVYQ